MYGERDGGEQEQNTDDDFYEHSGFRLPHTRNALALVGLGLALCGLASFRLLFLNVLEQRPDYINERQEPGHWEMDTVVGKKRTKARLLVLSERVTRREIIIRIKDGRAETVVAALDRLERIYGAAFYEIFKTITVDNGSEFADADGIERSARRKDAKRTTVYYCHAYSSCERGTNENINRMIRRQFPKGTDFDKVTAAEVKRVETWLNDYPREILGFMSSAEAFKIAFDRAA